MVIDRRGTGAKSTKEARGGCSKGLSKQAAHSLQWFIGAEYLYSKGVPRTTPCFTTLRRTQRAEFSGIATGAGPAR